MVTSLLIGLSLEFYHLQNKDVWCWFDLEIALIVDCSSFSLTRSQPELQLWCESVTTGVRRLLLLPICLPGGIRLSADSHRKQITVFVSTQPWRKKWGDECSAVWQNGLQQKQVVRGRPLWLVLGSVRQRTKTPTRHARLWTAECLRIVASWKRKKKCYSEASFVKKKPRTLFKPPVNRDGGLLRGRGGQLRSTLSNRECVVRGSLHPSCPLFSLVGAHRTCWPVLVDTGEVNAPAFFLHSINFNSHFIGALWYCLNLCLVTLLLVLHHLQKTVSIFFSLIWQWPTYTSNTDRTD